MIREDTNQEETFRFESIRFVKTRTGAKLMNYAVLFSVEFRTIFFQIFFDLLKVHIRYFQRYFVPSPWFVSSRTIRLGSCLRTRNTSTKKYFFQINLRPKWFVGDTNQGRGH